MSVKVKNMSVKNEMIKNLNEKECLEDFQTLQNKKELASSWFKEIRDKICSSFEEVENNKINKEQKIIFDQKKWKRNGGGGGVISIMHGNVFEKVGVNISTVHGKFS